MRFEAGCEEPGDRGPRPSAENWEDSIGALDHPMGRHESGDLSPS